MINWMDNFNIYGTDAGRVARLTNGVYASAAFVDLVVDPDPTAGGNRVLQSTNADFSNARKVLPAAITTVGIALRNWLSVLPSANRAANICTVQDVNANTHIIIAVDPSGYLKAYRLDIAGFVLLGTSAAPAIIANAWQHVETKVFLDAAVGTVEVRVEGITVLLVPATRTTSNVVAATASAQNVSLLGGLLGNYGGVTYAKDLIVWDSTGAFNNNFMGACQVLKSIPDADVALNWMLSAGGTGYNLINEVSPDDDGSYISAFAPLPTPVNGALSATVSGALAGATYFVRSTWVNSSGETLAAAETSLVVAANSVLNVAAPPTPPFGATGWNVYVSTAAGTETKQNGGVPIGIAAAWVEPNTGLVAGAALPGANTTTFPAAYKCSLSDLPVTVTSVRGIMPIHRSRKTDGGDGNIQIGAVSGASTGLGANRPITTAYTYWWDIYDADPNGTIAWTRTAFNALNLQLNRTL